MLGFMESNTLAKYLFTWAQLTLMCFDGLCMFAEVVDLRQQQPHLLPVQSSSAAGMPRRVPLHGAVKVLA